MYARVCEPLYHYLITDDSKSGAEPASSHHTKYPYSCCRPGNPARVLGMSEVPLSGTSCRISLAFPAKAASSTAEIKKAHTEQ